MDIAYPHPQYIASNAHELLMSIRRKILMSPPRRASCRHHSARSCLVLTAEHKLSQLLNTPISITQIAASLPRIYSGDLLKVLV